MHEQENPYRGVEQQTLRLSGAYRVIVKTPTPQKSLFLLYKRAHLWQSACAHKIKNNSVILMYNYSYIYMQGKLMENIKTHLRTKLITALGVDCKCQPSESIFDSDKEKVECAGDPIVRYTGLITDWSSSTYSVQELAKFIDSWKAVIEIDNGLFKWVFNVTNSHSSIEEFGSGDGLPDGTGGPGVGDDFGSGDIATIEDSIAGDEDIANVGGLSGELRVQMVGCIAALCMALAVLLSFA